MVYKHNDDDKKLVKTRQNLKYANSKTIHKTYS